ncbi:pilus assembly protein Flp/PilA [Ectothiorhodosinus mongolicus]|uniref:Pilus assembly protein Flp/PilA n=1 Tax=Ectothiorhodosinus mongolicus TaxID=233100 RepID=A0A1R3VM13_9GAMM|nr:Flp family type IVb pilin [Ectothiorhodosinus mongolicus]ULX57765.1 Flp family type IVb pilin [Ectothiorhodosinus mongolicus]SIT65628.1 pilus assembly protein Flp/PilA [Ectothiorhodosinus mongolicus]
MQTQEKTPNVPDTTPVSRRVHLQRGASLVEYGLLVALIAVVSVGLITTLGTEIEAGFQSIVTALTSGGGGTGNPGGGGTGN